LAAGEQTANVIISASGLFSTPNLPDIPGIASFEGTLFHTATWDSTASLAGQQVALIGTGSSGAQVMPKLAATAKTLSVFQRTPNWYSAMEGYGQPITMEFKFLLDRIPYYWNWYGYSRLVAALLVQDLQIHDRRWQKQGGAISSGNDKLREVLTNYLRQKLDNDPELIRKCTPSYAPLARRLVVDSGWFEALKRPNVELVVDGIERITPDGILTRDGTTRTFGVIVLGAGFRVSEYLWPVEYVGCSGRTPQTLWERDGARAYLGMTLPGFPNLFIFYGPNGQPRAGSFHSWAEVWTRYAASAIVAMLETNHRVIECRKEAFDKYNEKMDAEMSQMIWEQEGKSGYYVNAYGRSGVNMPWRTEQYHGATIVPDLTAFELR
jgi:4-hydroxyacetophenone monooxygenase